MERFVGGGGEGGVKNVQCLLCHLESSQPLHLLQSRRLNRQTLMPLPDQEGRPGAGRRVPLTHTHPHTSMIFLLTAVVFEARKAAA